MPGAGWLIAVALQLPPELAVGLILVGCAPSGTASNVMAFLAKGDGFGLGLGYLAGKLGRLDDKARRALAFEVGMQNSGLAATLATAHFTPLAALPSAVFSLWHNISGAIVAAWLARRPLQDAQQLMQQQVRSIS